MALYQVLENNCLIKRAYIGQSECIGMKEFNEEKILTRRTQV